MKNASKNRMIVSSLTVLCVLSTVGCNSGNSESSTAKSEAITQATTVTKITTTVATTTVATTTVATTTVATTTVATESELASPVDSFLSLEQDFSIDKMSIKLPSDFEMTYNQEEDRYTCNSDFWILTIACEDIIEMDSYQGDDYLKVWETLLGSKSTAIYSEIDGAASLTLKSNDTLFIQYLTIFNDKMYSIWAGSKMAVDGMETTDEMENVIKPMIDSIRFERSEPHTELPTELIETEPTITEIDSESILMRADFKTDFVMSGDRSRVLGKYGYINITKEQLTSVTMEEFDEFCNKKVADSGYNWVSIICDDGTGICFPGSYAYCANYGEMDYEGCISEAYGTIISNFDGTYTYYDSTQ